MSTFTGDVTDDPHPSDPVHYVSMAELGIEAGHGVTLVGWYFWTETWADRHGPYLSYDEATTALRQYCITQLGYQKGSGDDAPSAERRAPSAELLGD